jgi:hypothetical protein
MKKKVRIIKRTGPDGRIKYIIQQKHFLFRWWWVDAWINDGSVWCQDDFDTLEEAKKNLCYFDGTECKEEVVA